MSVAILDADRAGHEALRKLAVKVALRQAFGASIFNDAQEIIRSQLAELVFGSDDQSQLNRRTLEQIVHPVLRTDLQQQLQHVRELGQVQVVLLDAPILLESGWKSLCDAVVFIDTPLARRKQWTAAGRNWTVEELARREASQWPLARKQSESDFTIDNSGSLESSVDQLEQVVRGVRSHRLAEGRNGNTDLR